MNSLQTRVDRIEKSTTLVIEHSVQVEAAYKQSEDTRDFEQLPKKTAEALGAELGPKVQLPHPLPTESPEQWSAAEEGRPPGGCDDVVGVHHGPFSRDSICAAQQVEALEGPQYEPACEIAKTLPV